MKLERARELVDTLRQCAPIAVKDGLPSLAVEFNDAADMIEHQAACLEAAGHAPECGVNRCVECGGRPNAMFHKCRAEWRHDHKPGECTPECWQHPEWKA